MIQASHILCFDFRRGVGGIDGVASSCDYMWKQDAKTGKCWAQQLGQGLQEWWSCDINYFESIPRAALTAPLPADLVLNAWCVADTEIDIFGHYSPNSFAAPDCIKPADLLACGWHALGWDICGEVGLSYLYTYTGPGSHQHLRHRLNAVGLLDSYEECVEIMKVTDFSRYDPVDYIPVQLISTLGRVQV